MSFETATLEHAAQRAVVCAKPSDSIRSVVELFHRHSILSCPVAEESTPPKYHGLVDVMRVVDLMLQAFEHPAAIAEVDEDSIDDQIEAKAGAVFDALPSEFAHQAVGDIDLLPFDPLPEGCTLKEAICRMADTKAKRVPIINDAGVVVDMASQSAIVRQLAKKTALFPDLAATPLKDLDLGAPRDLFSVTAEQPVTTAFDLIRTEKVSAIPVVADGDQLLGEIDARFVYYISTAANKMFLLNQTCRQFLVYMSKFPGWGSNAEVLTAEETDTLGDLLGRVSTAHKRRVYLLNKGAPVRVISLRDLLVLFESL
ncbi:uncharacterized protein MONBRDRAFT_35438 [Monosiga brevicollis MX1]|uniref:CBS domain-containing protein n=1 Tax=Monosiga brevicollis TaxID=81824 RepID=A9UP15_MONBE|nr:uncharacterized protein MONBRDRAFT_35438 [Monosiga brevicollis MX1]EDQ92340.1 predicted protein [Monosiga brevicollis MX1]|eukprot:XP_001742102.1 hypothetical protein [Monosiga brevicollis MX1]